MGEAGNINTDEVRRGLIERSATDEAFRKHLLADPRGTVERELGKTLPEEVEVRVVEETPETIYLVLPPRAAGLREDGELSERDLDAVAGGWDQEVPPGYTLQCISTKSKKGCDPLP